MTTGIVPMVKADLIKFFSIATVVHKAAQNSTKGSNLSKVWDLFDNPMSIGLGELAQYLLPSGKNPFNQPATNQLIHEEVKENAPDNKRKLEADDMESSPKRPRR
ncbi:MAG: hypothetical protein JWM09_499 [Francisellaceae bacterium]|nr:hypothetical protein [Francisellaceae bacterium]